MKKLLLSLLFGSSLALGSGFFGGQASVGSLNNATLTGTVTLFAADQATITDGGDRTVFKGDTWEVKSLSGRNCQYWNNTTPHPQLTLTGCDLWMEPADGGGQVGSIAAYADGVDVGYSTYQQDDIVGFSPIRHLAMSGTQVFIPWASRASYTLGSMAAVMKHVPGGTPGGNNQGIQTTNINYWTMSSSGGGQYWEMYLGGSGLNLIQTNQNFDLNYDSGHGKLIIGDQNAASDGKRLQTITLSGGTIVKANDSVTAKTVPFCVVSSPSGTQGLLSYTVSAGVSYTINSTSATDASTLKCLLIENGR